MRIFKNVVQLMFLNISVGYVDVCIKYIQGDSLNYLLKVYGAWKKVLYYIKIFILINT